jgi:hypothetical protein
LAAVADAACNEDILISTYCSALTMSWTLIVLTYFCSLGLFPVVTPHVRILLFICPYETSSLFQTRPLTVFVLL